MAIANITGNILTDTGVAISSLVSGTGATNYLPKFTGASTIGDSNIWSNGTNVGIGNTNTTYTFDVTGTGRFTSTLLVSGALTGSAVATFTAAANPLILKSTSATTGYTEYYYNTSTLAGIIGNGGGILSGANNSDFIIRSEADFVVAAGGNNRRMTITSGGKVLIGTTTNVGQQVRIYQSTNGDWNMKLIQPNGSDQKFAEFLTTTDGDATVTARGSITYNGTNVLFNGTSDYRLKEDLKDYNGLNIISELKTYDFKWIEANKRDYGMMAHELQQVLPNYVTGEKDAVNEDGSIKPQGVDYSKLVPILIKAIQELNAKVSALENKS